MIDASILRSDTIDILHYDIHLDVTDETNNFIEGWTTVRFTPLMEDVESITLDLFELNIDSIVGENGPLEYSYDDECLIVQFDEIPELEDILEIDVYYNGNPHQDPGWGGFYFEQGYVYNLGIGLTSVPPNFGKVWYPCFDTFIERAEYGFHITSANGKRAHCQGTLMEEIELEGDTVYRHWELTQRIPTYITAIAVADYAVYEYDHEGLEADIPVTLTSKPFHQSAMQTAFSELGYAIDAFEYWFGPYPFDRVGYVLTTDGAMEHPTNIAYPQSMMDASLAANGGLMAHELGHCWWGDMVTLAEHNHMWMKEGPAEYSSHLFIEWKDGEEAFIEEVKNNQLFVLENAHYDDNGFHPMSPMPDSEIYGRHTYYKGASVMHNLRGYMGDELFRQAMTGIQETYPYTSWYPDDFKNALEEQSGDMVDLDPFFDDQIYQPGFSTFVADSTITTENGGTYTNVVYLQQKLREADNYYTDVPLNVSFVDESWERHNFQVTASGEYTEVTIETDFEPLFTITNGGYKLNQCRLDYTAHLYAENNFNQQLPFVDFRLMKTTDASDSALVRVEHVWAAPDDNPGEGVFDIGNRHYWRVDGVFPDEYLFEARITYDGVDEYDLDYDLVNVTEEELVLIYRPDPSHTWEVYPDYTWYAGGMTSATGTIAIDILLPGEYALANGDRSVSVNETPEPDEDNGFAVYPNPARIQMNMVGNLSRAQRVNVMVADQTGRTVIEETHALPEGEYRLDIDVDPIPQGWYVISLVGENGELLDSTTFEVMK